MAQAGEQFICVVDGHSYDESVARFDDDLQAPVCADCKRLLDWSKAWLKKNKIGPVCSSGHNRLI